MSERLSFFVPMQPPSVTSQQKRLVMVGGKPRFFKSAKQKEAGNLYFALLQPHRPEMPLEGPLEVWLTFRRPWRKSERRSIIGAFTEYPCETRPDVENSAKQVCDVMTSLRFWEDDAQIAILRLEKCYGDEPGLTVIVTPIIRSPALRLQDQSGEMNGSLEERFSVGGGNMVKVKNA